MFLIETNRQTIFSNLNPQFYTHLLAACVQFQEDLLVPNSEFRFLGFIWTVKLHTSCGLSKAEDRAKLPGSAWILAPLKATVLEALDS